MCIAVFKPKGIDIPSESILKNCFESNSDGAGMAFAYNGRVYIKKGFMTFDAFMDSFNMNNQKYGFKDLGLLLHFRIRTHGKTDATMTHPFPIVADEGALCKSELVSNYAVIHNGIISLTTSEAVKSGLLSDTAIFIRDYLALIAQNEDWFTNKSDLNLIERLLGTSKMAILNSDGDIMYTRGFTEDGGIYYSNASYKDYYTRYGKSYYKGSCTTSTGKSYNYNADDYYGGYGYYYDKHTSGGENYNWNNRNPSSASTSKDSKTSTLSSKIRTIGLMRALPNETIEYDGQTQYIEPSDSDAAQSDAKESFWINQSGAVYVTDGNIDDIMGNNEYYLLGTKGTIYTAMNQKREFKADITVFPDQFPEM